MNEHDTKTLRKPDYQIELAATTDGGGERVPDLSPREARDRWLDKLRVSKTESTVSSYHYRTKHFVEWCEDEGITSIAALSGWDMESFETERRRQGLAPISLSKEMGTLKNLIEYCARIELVDDALPEKVDPPDVPRDAQVDETRLTPEDAAALLTFYEETPAARHSRRHCLLALAWYTGIRLGGIRALDLEDFDANRACLEFRHRPRTDTPLKNGPDGERVVGLTANACAIVEAYVATDRDDVVDDHGRRPLITTSRGRASAGTIRGRMYLATIPCLHSPCPHGNDPDTCEWTAYTHASKCPSSRSPHQVRTGSVTWQLNRGVPMDVVANRVNASVRTIENHYDVPDKFAEMEQRRRPYLDRLGFDADPDGDGDGDGEQSGEES